MFRSDYRYTDTYTYTYHRYTDPMIVMGFFPRQLRRSILIVIQYVTETETRNRLTNIPSAGT
jgi:hydrogenase maturation factor